MKKMQWLPVFVVIALANACTGHSNTGETSSVNDSSAILKGGDSAAHTAIPAGKRAATDTGGRASLNSDTAVKRFFRGTGTEPFWSLSIDFTRSIIFKDVEGKEIEVPAGKGEKAMDANVIRYASGGNNGNLVVQIAKQECINDMSGQKFDYTVTIDVQQKDKADVQTYRGCGRYLSVDPLSK